MLGPFPYQRVDATGDLMLTVEGAKALASKDGELFIAGNGDSRVILNGDWILTSTQEAKQATYYSDVSDTVDLVVNKAKSCWPDPLPRPATPVRAG